MRFEKSINFTTVGLIRPIFVDTLLHSKGVDLKR